MSRSNGKPKVSLQLYCCKIMFDYRCQDYLLIHRGVAGTTELCGKTTTNDSVFQLESGEFNVIFRSSEERNFTGFQMYVICFREDEADIKGA